MLTLFVDGEKQLEVQDDTYQSGMWGLGALSMGRSYFGAMQINEL